MNCKHCGFELPDTAKFCRSCGKPQGVGIEQVLTAPARAPAAKSVALKSMLISIAIVGSVGGIGYWGWTQKVVADEKKSVAARLQAALTRHSNEKHSNTALEIIWCVSRRWIVHKAGAS